MNQFQNILGFHGSLFDPVRKKGSAANILEILTASIFKTK
jgi:hypothetical protein